MGGRIARLYLFGYILLAVSFIGLGVISFFLNEGEFFWKYLFSNTFFKAGILLLVVLFWQMIIIIMAIAAVTKANRD